MKTTFYATLLSGLTMLNINAQNPAPPAAADPSPIPFEVKADRFADIQVLRYHVPGFDELTLKQKKFAYYLVEAGLAGRDIFYDQKYKHNLLIRKTLEAILSTWKGDKSSDDYKKFLV